LSEALIKHPCTKKVTFTGSTRIGKLVAKLAAESGPKKITMELGGNCPFIVFDDADLDQACAQLMALKWRHAGQACISANRIYVQNGVYDKFAEMLREKTAALVVGHGGEKGTTMGPVTTPRGLDKAEAQAEDAVKKGAKMILGTGKRGGGKKGGYFMEPTILTGMKSDMLMSTEETFAPVAGLYKFETEEEAVRWANDTSMGLASYAFTKNVDRMWRMLENLEAGMVGMVSSIVLLLLDACVMLTWRAEYWQLVCGRSAIRWYQGLWIRKGERQRRGCRGVSRYQDWYIHYRWTVLVDFFDAQVSGNGRTFPLTCKVQQNSGKQASLSP
jgi:acyl-CoA reductase-like NAD-dependent aldehyde dehydrogenase